MNVSGLLTTGGLLLLLAPLPSLAEADEIGTYGPPAPVTSAPSRSTDSPRSHSLIRSVGKTVVDDAQHLVTSPLRLDVNSALLVGGVAAAIGGLYVLDDDIHDAFQENRSPASDDAGRAFKTLGEAETVLAGNLGLIGIGWWFREHERGNKLWDTALLSLEAQLFTEAASGLTKFAVGRARPSAGISKDSFEPFEGFDRSFPSSHAARAFAVATVFADRYEQPVPFLAYATATLIALSRIHSNEHFASDVAAGAALGLAIGKLLTLRHTFTQDGQGFTLMPFAADAQGGLGLTVHARF